MGEIYASCILVCASARKQILGNGFIRDQISSFNDPVKSRALSSLPIGCRNDSGSPAQAADKKLGMINIRSDDDMSPKDVLDGMTPDEAAQVRAHAALSPATSYTASNFCRAINSLNVLGEAGNTLFLLALTVIR